MVKVKICGLTLLEDALFAAAAGADALGFVFAPGPRRISPEKAREIIGRLPPLVLTVGVFVDESPARVLEIKDYCGLDAVQLHGEESEAETLTLGRRVIKAWRVRAGTPVKVEVFPAAILLLDSYDREKPGGAGRVFDWDLAREAARRRPVILAGGLNPENVARAVETVRPYGVDVSSGVESRPGKKDHIKIARFIERARAVGTSGKTRAETDREKWL
ncbi:MAG: phosphoribosylanthranilate isomerase [Thermodesulfobacteriota bacterium]